jgi:multiple sugar transport system substrate-binding protein
MSLKIAVRDWSAFERAIGSHIEAWSGDAEFVSFDIGEHELRFVSGSDPGDFDLFLSVTDWIPEGAKNGAFVDLTSRFEDDPPVGWPEGWHKAMHQLVEFDGAVWGLPYHDGPQVLHYRKDLFEDPEEQQRFKDLSGFDLRPPKSWPEFLDVAVYFTRPLEGLWGACMGAYPDGHNNVYDFLVHLWSRGGELLTDGRPSFASREGEEALQFMHNLVHVNQVVEKTCLDLNSVESGDYYASGRAAMMWNWSGFAVTAEEPDSQIRGLNACSMMPKGRGKRGRSVSLNVFWAMTILSSSKNQDEAWEFFKHIAQAEMDVVTTESGCSGVRLSTWQNPEIQSRLPAYQLMEPTHENSQILPRIPEYPAINSAISDAVAAVMKQEMRPQEALQKAQNRAEEILAG